jgi:hypothetical protein
MLCLTNVGDYVTIECAVDKTGWQALGKAQSAWLQSVEQHKHNTNSTLQEDCAATRFVLAPAFFLEYTCGDTFKIKCNVRASTHPPLHLIPLLFPSLVSLENTDSRRTIRRCSVLY